MQLSENYYDPEVFPGASPTQYKNKIWLFAKVRGMPSKGIKEFRGKIRQRRLLSWLKKNSAEVRDQWDAVVEQTKNMKLEYDAAKGAARAELERMYALPAIDVSFDKDGSVLKQVVIAGQGDATPPKELR